MEVVNDQSCINPKVQKLIFIIYKQSILQYNGCKAALYLQATQNTAGLCFVSIDDHSNHPDQEKEQIESRVVNRIKELEAMGIKADGIIKQFIRDGIQPPSKIKLNNILQSIRKSKKESPQPTLSDLKKCCDQYSEIPEDPNQVKLIQFALQTNYVLSDATYKITYGGFPALTGGTTDRDKKFHPFGLALCATEKNQDFGFFFRSVEVAAFNVYGHKISPTVLVADMPFQLKGASNHNFHTGTLSTCSSIIRKKKWKTKNSPEIKEFINYFMNQWGNENNGWYKGYYGGILRTTNGLESSHEKIKAALREKDSDR
ncbi:unnamed protein product [Brachionus calyciflorus]|uniref:MULE transposase domain-containing protein n=1 Tax=Brachionus calyciflorus TaxID=104777 RepID=A0A813LXU4_9BILA|nr:unnamed protein product [Brachionus calyciflorus]